jgi:hypothetical protein
MTTLPRGWPVAEHVITRLKPRHFLADRLDAPGDIHAPNAGLGVPQSEAHDAHQLPLTCHEVPDAQIKGGRVHPYQPVVLPDSGFVEVPEFPDVG